MNLALRIAIACSGLGHVQRGIESWACDTAQALRRAGADVTLFAGARLEGAEAEALPTLRRTGRGAIAMAGGLRHLGGWRFGAGSAYEVEQTSFALSLWRRIRDDFDILHVQDPMIAIWLERLRRAGLSRTKVIYANGTGEGASVMQRFPCLQLLTQAAAEDWMPRKPKQQSVFMIPNFINTAHFHPGDQAACRQRFGLPLDRTIVLCCAAIRRVHKRIDVLLHEFADFVRIETNDAILVIAGGREADTDSLITEGTALLGERVRFLPDLPRHLMPDLYRSADAFVLPSLQEMFGIVLLEALATGLPVVCNDTPDFRNIVGPGGFYANLGCTGGITRGLAAILQPNMHTQLAKSARSHVEQYFSETKIIYAITDMYNSVSAAAHDT